MAPSPNASNSSLTSGERRKSQRFCGPNNGRYPAIRLFVRPKLLFSLLKCSYSDFSSDRGTRMAASLAYYTIVSLAPLLLIAIAIAGFVFGREAAQDAISAEIQSFVGADAANVIRTMIQSAHKPAHGLIASVVGVVVLLFGASGVFGEIQDALNVIWDANTKAQSGIWNLVKERLLSFGMVIVIGFLLLVSLMISAFLAGMFKFIGGAVPVPEILLHGVELLVSVCVITLLFALLFKVLPDFKLTWNDVFFGAFTTAVLFTVGKFAIGMYLGKTVSSSTYGAAGAVILVISWVYYSALILYFGAEFTHVYANQFGPSVVRHPETERHQ
jgi:membrane protein